QEEADCGFSQLGGKKWKTIPINVPPLVRTWLNMPMKRNAREFIRSTTTLLDHVLPTLTQEEQHELLDALAGEIEERLDALVEAVES
ncbi:MAG: hypothetical protein NTX35_20635, partial [Verrucomicrobia bacterium]|nr:hypothetical protein [Verrucomicrobiota bacterium]